MFRGLQAGQFVGVHQQQFQATLNERQEAFYSIDLSDFVVFAAK
jgi:hypothetical protein